MKGTMEKFGAHVDHLFYFKQVLDAPLAYCVQLESRDYTEEKCTVRFPSNAQSTIDQAELRSPLVKNADELEKLPSLRSQIVELIREKKEEPTEIYFSHESLDTCDGEQENLWRWYDSFDFVSEVKPLLEDKIEDLKECLLAEAGRLIRAKKGGSVR